MLIHLKITKAEREHWSSLGNAAQYSFERRASFLLENGYVDRNVDLHALAVKTAYKLRDAPPAEGLVYTDGSKPHRPE
jgi:hypothetical protein